MTRWGALVNPLCPFQDFAILELRSSDCPNMHNSKYECNPKESSDFPPSRENVDLAKHHYLGIFPTLFYIASKRSDHLNHGKSHFMWRVEIAEQWQRATSSLKVDFKVKEWRRQKNCWVVLQQLQCKSFFNVLENLFTIKSPFWLESLIIPNLTWVCPDLKLIPASAILAVIGLSETGRWTSKQLLLH